MVWAELLVDGLAAAGVRHAVISPGSRSTPLALAVARHPRIACTVVVDERCAAFVALGQARVTGVPSLAVCTSGTAGAHYLPAVIEASEASVPLVLLTADRPPELQQRGALQTTRQAGLFGGFVRAALELGVPDAHPAALAGVRGTAALAVQAALDPRPGPVHLNAAFRAPLEPLRERADDEAQRRSAAAAARAAPARRVAAPALLDSLADACAAAAHGVIVAGPGPVAQREARGPVAALARRLGWPVAAEAGSQLRFAASSPAPTPLELLVGPAMPEVEFVLVVGSWPTSMAWSRALASRTGTVVWVVCEHGWVDPLNRAAGIVAGDVTTALRGVVERLGSGEPRDPTWLPAWSAAARHVARVLEEAEAEERARATLSETVAVRAAVRALPEGGWLALSNSLAIREVDLACPSHGVTVNVLTQRGVSGIDGHVSGAAGAALATGEALLLVTGDVAFQHDLGGLATAAAVRAPLVIVVLNNRGGRLFELLPLVDGAVSDAEVEKLFVAPQGLDVIQAARAFGVGGERAVTAGEVEAAVRGALARGGCTVIEAVITAGDLRQRRRALAAAAQAGWHAVPR